MKEKPKQQALQLLTVELPVELTVLLTVLLQAMVYLIWDYLTDNMSKKYRLPTLALKPLGQNLVLRGKG
jgi:hypothetical protein